MNAVTQSKPVTPADQLRRQLDAMRPEFSNALPSHIKPEKFQRVVMTVVQQQPDLLVADRRSLLASCTKCAQDGLIPDGREAALVIFNTKVKGKNGEQDRWEKRVQYMPMIAGILKRVRNSGEIAGMEAHVIYENDEFVWRQGTDAALLHTPKFPGSRGKPIGAYAVARFKDGSTPQVEVMDVDTINRIRAVSKSKDGPAWTEWWDEMARKSVARRLSKWLPANSDVDDLIRRDDENDAEIATSGIVVDGEAEAPAQQISASSKLDALEGEVMEGEIITPDPEAETAAAYVAEIAALDTAMDVKAWGENKTVHAQMVRWKADRPDLFKLVDEAVATRLA